MWIMDTWQEIGEAINNGTYISRYSIGDVKDIDIMLMHGEKQTIQMQIVAFNEDNHFDTAGKTAITWISKDIITYCGMNSDNINQGGWMLSDMRDYCAGLYSSLDEDVKTLIKPVRKVSYHCDTDSSHITKDYCWIPSYREAFGSSAFEYHGPTYTMFFSLRGKHVKKDLANNICEWWLRTCCPTDTFHFLGVSKRGKEYSYCAGNADMGTVLGFCT